MGLKNLIGKKGASDATPKPPKKHRGLFGRKKNKGARLNKKRSKKMNHQTKNMAKEYPILAKMKLPQVLATVTLSKIEDEAKSFGGAVRKVEYNGQVGYSVIAVSESELADAGMTDGGEDSDLGQFAASIRNELILSASLAADLADGELILVPTESALDSLSEFDEFMNDSFKFHWAIYPGDIESDDDPAMKSEVLDSMVSLATLQEISDNNYDLRQEGSELVDYNPDDTTPDVSSAFDDDNSALGTDFDDDEGYEDVDDDTDLSVDDVDANAGVSGIDTGDSGFAEPDSGRNVLPNPGTDNQPSSDDAISDDDFNDLLSGVSEDDGSDEVNLDDIPADTGYDSANEAVSASTQVADSNQADATPQEQTMTADDYSATVSRLEADRLQNKNLGISLDPSAFNRLFGDIRPLQFKIAPVDANDRVGQMANAYRENANSKLRSMSESKKRSLLQEYNQSVLSAMNEIELRLNVDDEKNLVGAQMKKLNDQRAERQKKEDQLIESRQKSINEKYDADKEKFIKQQQEAMAKNYDIQHQQELQQSLNRAADDVRNDTKQRFVNDRKELMDKRQRLASDIMGQVVAQVLQGLENEAKSYSRHEHAVFDGFSKSINDLYSDNYQNELNRKQAERDLIQHDTAVQEAQANEQKAREELKAKVKEMTDEAERKLAHERQLADQEKERQRQNYEKRLKEKQETLDAIQKASDSAEDRHNRELDQVRKQDNEEKRDLRDQLKEARNSSTNSAKQSSIRLVTIAAVTGILTGIGGFGLGIYHNVNNQQPASQQQSTSHDSGDSGKTVINVNGNGTDSKKKSSNASSSSQVDHTTSSTEDAGDASSK